MRSWKFFTPTLTAALVLAGTALAQPPGGPPPGGPGRFERVLDDLKLTDKQKDQAQDVLKAHGEKMRKVMEQNREDLLKEMKDVLSDEQLKKFKDATEQGPGRGPGGRAGPGGPGGGRGGPGGPGGGFERVLDDLKLTDKQKDKAEEALKANHEKGRKLMDQGHEDVLKGMKDVLTEAQYKKFKDALETQGPGGPGGGPGGRGGSGGPGGRGGPGGFGPGGFERLLDDVKMSKKERDKAEEVLAAHQEKVRKVLDQAREDMLKQMKDVLSDDAFKQFKDALEKQGPPGPPRGRDGDRPARP